MRVEIQSFEGCPHAAPAQRLVADVVARLAPDAEVALVPVETPEEARRLGFLGSPSVRVDGEDVEGRLAVDPDLCCRVYPDGGGVPPRWMVEAAVLRALRPQGILFLCVANSARSQMAEGLARRRAPAGVAIWSAGSAPSRVHPLALAALGESGVDASAHRSKAIDAVPRDRVDAVVTLCAEEVCPAWLGHAAQVHWGLPDPATGEGDEAARLAAFRDVRDALDARLALLFRPFPPTETPA